MITIGYCTKESNINHTKHLIKTCGLGDKKVEVIEIVNKGDRSLTECYNEILKRAKNNHVVFCHDDLTIETNQWGTKLLKQFARNPEYGIIGVAGTKHLPSSGRWWEQTKKMYGRVAHTHDGRTWLSTYSNDLGHNIEKTIIVDGVFFAVDKRLLLANFDEDVKGFHFYDVTFCFDNFIKGVNIGVSTMIRVNHQSIGMTNEAWEFNRQNFAEKYKQFLPCDIKETFTNTKLKVLTDEKTFNERITYFCNDKLDVYVISNNKPNPKLKKFGIKTLDLKEPIGYKLGDGKWSLDIQGESILSQDKMLYKMNDFTFDIIHLIDFPNQILDYLIKVYPESKIYQDKRIFVNLFEDYKNVINPLFDNDTQYEEGITFIIPTLNRPTLTNTVNSIINQSNPNWKCKIVFDGVEPIYFDDDRIESIKIEKAGLIGPANGQAGLVRNHGIEKVDTEWIGFVDDDDTLTDDYVDSLLNNYQDKDFVIFKMRYENGLVLPRNEQNEIKFGDVGISFAYKTKLNMRFTENRDGEDFDFLLNLKNKTNNYIISDEIMYNVRA